MKYITTAIAAGAVLTMGSAAFAATEWDMPMAYPESNYKTAGECQ